MKSFLFILIMFASGLYAGEIPEERLVDWGKAGAVFVCDSMHIITSSSLGLDNTGNNDNTAVINNAIDTASKPLMFLFEPGIYLFNGTIKLKSNVCISGYSSENTFFKFDMHKKAAHCFNISGGAASEFTDVSGGYFRNNDYLTTEQYDIFATGDYVEIHQENGNWDSNPANWAKYSVGQVLKIKSIHKDTLFFYEKLRIDYTAGLHPRLRKINPIENCEIKYLNIERIDLPDNGAPYNILLSFAVNCGISGVESNKSVGSHIMITLSKNITVSGSYFHNAFIFDGSGTKGYGVTLNNHASDCLVENNIFRYLRHAMMVKHGANGNVFAYNYSLEPHRSEPIADLSGDISLHGHFAYANLFEGNIVQNIITDDFWGPSGPLNTFFRNRAELYGIISTSDKSDSMNYAGNEVTNTTPLMGQFLIKGNGHYFCCNNIKGEILPDDSDDLTRSSIFYDKTPAFWDIPAAFPTIGIPNDLGKHTIPAKYRYDNRKKKTVGEYIPVSVALPKVKDIQITPNPATDYVDIAVVGGTNRTPKDAVVVYDESGSIVLTLTPSLSLNGKGVKVDVSGLAAGVYFVHIAGKMYKFVKM
jgi:hypothetical protein